MQKPNIRAVIWDIGGVLVRTEDREPRRLLAERLGMSRDELVHLVFDSEMGQKAQSGQESARALWEHVCQSVGWPVEQIQALESEFFAGDRLDTELVDYIRSLRPRYRTGIISNALDDVRQAIEERWQMADAFDHIVISAEVKMVKPHPRIFQAALQGLGVQAHEAVFIDDFPQNITGAQQAGLHAIQFLNPVQARRDLEALLDER